MTTTKYDKLWDRVEAVVDRVRPMQVIFVDIDNETGEVKQSEPVDPTKQQVIFETTYLTEEETLAERVASRPLLPAKKPG